jgi:hypothetical protein
MPVRRKLVRRGVTEGEQGEAWSEFFRSGHDFFHDLPALGIHSHKAAQKAARKAWRRYGAQFLARWEPDPCVKTPWALERFGSP